MEKEILFRKATENDLETLLQFEQGIIRTERPFDPTLRPGHIHYYDLREMLRAENTLVMVAELDHRVIASGYATIRDSESFLSHDKHAYLGFMFVVPEHRGKGINKGIIESLIKWATSKNMTEIRLQVYDQNKAAIRAYEKIGFSKYMIQMRMERPLPIDPAAGQSG
ncbi:MAG: GNAT family N-acetyltransferase [Bacteroidota bacterium]|nr:GNAT family N-acetyltransferase [Bacteroidota bacterium]MDP4245358.1 GNAT family N-acetyltransferase [Bacteroidota bacterium]